MRLCPWPFPLVPPSRGNRSGGELLFDSFVDARAGEPRGHTNGVFYGVGVGTSMANHADAAHTEKRRAAVLCIVNLLLQAFERDRKSTRLNSSHGYISYAVFCLKQKN